MLERLHGLFPAKILVLLCFVISGCTSTALLIDTDPPEATILIDGTPLEGEAPFFVRNVKTGLHQFQIAHPEYIQIDTSITIPKGGVDSLFFKLKRYFGTLYISTTPAPAFVSIYTTGRGPLQEIERGVTPVEFTLPPGSYSVRMDAGVLFDTLQIQIQIQSGKAIHLDTVSLSPKPGTLSISTIPDSATVLIFRDGNEVPETHAVTPAEIKLSPGLYRIELSKGETYVEESFPVQIKSTQTLHKDVLLSERQVTLSVRSTPEGSKVWLDGALQEGETPLVIRNVQPGNHVIRIDPPSVQHRFTEKRVALAPGDTVLHFALDEQRSTLRIATTPSGAKVSIESIRSGRVEQTGISPTTMELPPGEYKVTITKKPFYGDSSERVHIQAGRNAKLTKTLSLIPFLKEHFVRIPAGSFNMGTKNGNRDEQPVHKVILDEYWIGRHEVTVREYAEFVRATNYEPNTGNRNGNWGKDGRENHPINFVSWYDAKAYTQWLSEKTGFNVRLPTEAEWERVARGPEGRIYPWGNTWAEAKANFCDRRCTGVLRDASVDDGYTTTAPVTSFRGGVSAWGAYQLAGNVSEWCEDYYSDRFYSTPPTANPRNNTASTHRVVRGGAWDDHAEWLQSTIRFKIPPSQRLENIGFRVVIIH